MWCAACEPYKNRLDREVAQGKKHKNECNEYGRKWVRAERYKRMCRICTSEGRSKKALKEEEVQGEKRVLRHTT